MIKASVTITPIFLALLFLSYLQAATLPYTNDFSSDVSDFVTENGTWTLVGGTYVNTPDASGGGSSRSSAALDVTGIGGATPQDFTLTGIFSTANASSAGNSHDSFGFGLFGDSQANADSNYLLIDFSTADTLRIFNVGANQGAVNITNDTTPVTHANGVDYTFTADFDYTGTDLVIEFSVSDGTNTGTIITPSFDSVALGLDSSIVAITNREAPNTTGAFEISVDSISIIPEPGGATLFMIGISGLCLTLRRIKH